MFTDKISRVTDWSELNNLDLKVIFVKERRKSTQSHYKAKTNIERVAHCQTVQQVAQMPLA